MQMHVKIWRAIVSGILWGVVVLVAIGIAGHIDGSHADLCALTGLIIVGHAGAVAWLAGCATQLSVAVIAGLIYAAIFEWVARRSGALVGAAIAIPHATLAGLAVGLVPASRVIDAGLSPPGLFLQHRGGLVATTFVLAHLAFGTGMGISYGRTSDQPAAW